MPITILSTCIGKLVVLDREWFSLIRTGIKNNNPKLLFTNTIIVVGILGSSCLAMVIDTLKDKAPIVANNALINLVEFMAD